MSYAHADNDAFGGWLAEVAKRLQAHLRTVNPKRFKVFLDYEDTPIGRWKEEHHGVLDEVPFLVAVVTPSFIASKVCRREVKRFSERKSGLVVPVFFIACEPESPVERKLLKQLEGWQAELWQELRTGCHAPESQEVQRALVHLADRMREKLAASRNEVRPESELEPVPPKRIARRRRPAGPADRSKDRVVRRTDSSAAAREKKAANEQGFEQFRWLKDDSVMIRIPAGRFVMGSDEYDNEKPVHEVELDEYLIDKCPVTNRQYRQFCDETNRPYPPDPGFGGMADYFTKLPDYPAVNVSWDDAAAYCVWAGKRLPTEAEWERAARGVDRREYPWGEQEPDATRANFGMKQGHPTRVGEYPAGASAVGALDMAGNVWEWCNDWYGTDYYSKSVGARNPKGPEHGSFRVLRGGSWNNGAWNLRCAYRNWSEPSDRGNCVGFRCSATSPK